MKSSLFFCSVCYQFVAFLNNSKNEWIYTVEFPLRTSKSFWGSCTASHPCGVGIGTNMEPDWPQSGSQSQSVVRDPTEAQRQGHRGSSTVIKPHPGPSSSSTHQEVSCFPPFRHLSAKDRAWHTHTSILPYPSISITVH